MSELWWRTRWLDAIYDSDLKPSQRFVAMVYADFAGAGRMSWASIGTVMHRTGYSNKGVILARRALIEKGWMIETSKASRHRASTFALVIPEGFRGERGSHLDELDVNEVHPSENLGVNEVHHQGCTTFTSRGERGSHKKSSSNPESILSRGQAIAQDLLDCDEQDERLMFIDRILEANAPRSARAWLKTVIDNGDLDELIEAQSNAPSATGPPVGGGWGADPAERPPADDRPECDDPDCDGGLITEDNDRGHPISRRCPNRHTRRESA